MYPARSRQIIFELCEQVENAIFNDDEDGQDPLRDNEKNTEDSHVD